LGFDAGLLRFSQSNSEPFCRIRVSRRLYADLGNRNRSCSCFVTPEATRLGRMGIRVGGTNRDGKTAQRIKRVSLLLGNTTERISWWADDVQKMKSFKEESRGDQMEQKKSWRL
jgi:hypothetical protein